VNPEQTPADQVPLEFLVVGNGASIATFEWERLRPDIRVILCNGAYEVIPVEPTYVVCSDEHWVTYLKEHCPHPFYTKSVWGDKHGVPSIPNSHKDSVTGPLAIQLAWCFSPQRIWVIGFDILTHDSGDRYHNHPIKRRQIVNARRFQQQYNEQLRQCEFEELQLLITPEQWRKYLYTK